MLLDKNLHIVNPVKSSYNAKVYKNDCERCGEKGIDVHHIRYQNDFKHEKNNRKMNAASNLTILCKECHHMIHSGNVRVNQIATPNGVKNTFI